MAGRRARTSISDARGVTFSAGAAALATFADVSTGASTPLSNATTSGTFRASAFDIAGSDSARGYALINSSGDEEIVLIDLAAGGAVRDVYAFTNGLTGLRGLAVRSYPSTLWGLDRNNRLSQFPSSRPSQILRTLDITGLQAGEKVIGIDYAYLFPPFLDDVFFGVTDQNRLYRISPDTGVATQAGLYSGGHGAVGVTSPANEWFLAEGATGPFFDTFVLLANPGTNDASATVTFLPASGAPVQVTKSVAAGGRTTINIETEDPTLDNVPVATKITSTQPIVVERAMYWPGNGLTWYEAHDSFGLTATGTRWGLAEGRIGGADNAQTYILLANPGTATASVTITYLREQGSPISRTYTVDPASRFNVQTNEVTELIGESFGALIVSDQPIAVERAVYTDANGVTWAAGTNATATRLP